MKIYYSNEPSGEDGIDKYLNLFLEKCKYQLMWHLRDLEDMINAEKYGRITIIRTNDEYFLNIKGFSEKLLDEILMRCENIKFEFSH